MYWWYSINGLSDLAESLNTFFKKYLCNRLKSKGSILWKKTKIFKICLLVKFASHGISLRWNLSYFNISELIVRNITGLRHMHWLGIQSLEGGLYLKKVGGGLSLWLKWLYIWRECSGWWGWGWRGGGTCTNCSDSSAQRSN